MLACGKQVMQSPCPVRAFRVAISLRGSRQAMSNECGPRKFFSLPDDYRSGESAPLKCADTAKLVNYIDQNVIGKNTTFDGPFGKRKVVYCDYTASGRALNFIEDFIRHQVLPCYGNTHTTTSVTSLQSTLYRHEARTIFRNAVNASEHDAVIFVGSGCTGAVHKLISALQLAAPPVVLVGPCEHHSNLLPWREVGALVVRIPEDKDGCLDIDVLEQQLQAHATLGRQMIGCFSAASNVTGIMADDVATTLLLHQYGALAFWDYAAAAPYVKMDMNPLLPGAGEGNVCKDAMFFSVHKFVGGVQTPGVLVAKKSLFKNSAPDGCGGGTVFFVTKEDHRYVQDVEVREEGGTGAIVESVRAGLAMQLKENVGVSAIMAREEKITKTVLSHIKMIPELLLLGPPMHSAQQRLPIFSFMIRHPRGTFLHHNFVCTVLNDVFGIQARGGCACAGPYAQDLLGIDENLAKEYENILLEDSRLDRTHLRRQEEHSNYEMLRPGFARISLPYFMPDEEVAFVLEAVKMVALEGWKLLSQYILSPETGEWRHRSNLVFKDRRWLGDVNYSDGKMNFPEVKAQHSDQSVPTDHADILQVAKNIFSRARKLAQRYSLADQRVLFDEKTEKLRWFMLPSEAQDLLLGHSQNVKHSVPFDPVGYEGSRASPLSTPTSPPTVIVDSDTGSPINFAVGGGFDVGNLSPHLMSERARTLSFNCSSSLNNSMTLDPFPSLQLHHRNCSSQTDVSSSRTDGAPRTKAEIKYQNKAVISAVQDLLEVSDLSESRPRTSSMSLKSAEEVAEYLVEASQRLASEVKSELKEIVSAVDELITEDSADSKNNSTSALNQIGPVPEQKVDPMPNQDSPSSILTRDSSTFTNHLNQDAMCKIIKAPEQKNNKSNLNDDKTKTKETCLLKRRKANLKPLSKSGWHYPPKHIWKPTIEAVRDFDMIRDGDKVLICLSGGKDSLSLLHTIHQYQFYARSKGTNFQLGAVTVDPGSVSYNPRPLIAYLKSLNVPYFYEEQGILDKAAELREQDACKSICSFCSRMKRGRLYAAARREGYNVLALGQHLDDLGESFMMSVFHNGRMRTMKAHYTVKENDLRVIRPFVFVREKNLRQFAEERNLPVIPENCPACFEAPKERHRTKQLLAQQEILFPRLFLSLKSAMMPLMSVHKTGVESKLFARPRHKRLPTTSSIGADSESEELAN